MLDGQIADESAILGQADLTVGFGCGGDGCAELAGLEADGEDERERVFRKWELRCRGEGGAVRGGDELEGEVAVHPN